MRSRSPSRKVSCARSGLLVTTVQGNGCSGALRLKQADMQVRLRTEVLFPVSRVYEILTQPDNTQMFRNIKASSVTTLLPLISSWWCRIHSALLLQASPQKSAATTLASSLETLHILPAGIRQCHAYAGRVASPVNHF